jgi:NTP pyrophosphatase (non-canonical NTP hydrolase)
MKVHAKDSQTLVWWQENLRTTLAERGFDDETIEQKFLLFAEEVGELAKAIRKTTGVKMADDTKRTNLQEEIGDVFILLVDICNKLGVDLEQSVILKEGMNSKRVWK